MMSIFPQQDGRWWWPMHGAWDGGAMMFFMTFFWILAIVLVGWLAIRLLGGGGAGNVRGDRSEAILRERYARGEIDRETYERMLDELGHGV